MFIIIGRGGRMITRILNKLRRKTGAKAFIFDDKKLIQVDFIPLVVNPKPKKTKRKSKTLTRNEMWEIICDKYKLLNNFSINPQNMGDSYIHRTKIWDFFVELNLHNSERLTKEQKEKVKREIVDRI